MDASATNAQVDLNRILDQLKSLPAIAKDNDWVFRINDLDQAIYSSERVPSGSFLWSYDDEKYLYIDENSNVNGFFIEYFSNNFLEHEEKYKPILKELKRTKTGQKVLKDNSSIAEKMLIELEKEVLVDFSEYKDQLGNNTKLALTS